MIRSGDPIWVCPKPFFPLHSPFLGRDQGTFPGPYHQKVNFKLPDLHHNTRYLKKGSTFLFYDGYSIGK